MSDDTEAVLVVLTVPAHWVGLSQAELERKLRGNEQQLIPFLAAEVKRWAGRGTIDLAGLERFIDDRTGK